MANTQGFEIVAELTPPVLLQMMQAAWKSGGTPGTPGVIPQNFNIPPGLAFGPLTIQDGQVQIPEAGLGVQMAPDVNGVALQFDLQIQVEFQNPPVPSASMIALDANVTAKVPVGSLPGQINVAMLLTGLPRGNVSVTLPGGDPIAPNLDGYITDFIHQLYTANGPNFPHHEDMSNQDLVLYTANASIDLYDDPQDPAHQIQVAFPPNQLAITVPIHLKIYQIVAKSAQAPALSDPMGVEAQFLITADLVENPGSVSANLPAAQVQVQNIVPAGPAYGNEGPHYTANKATLASVFIPLDTAISTALQQQGQRMIQNLQPVTFDYPTETQIENFIGDQFFQQLTAEGSISVWTPETPGGPTPVQLTDVTVQALTDALAIAINSSPGSNASLLTNFVPAGMSFAFALSGTEVLNIIQQTIHSPVSQGGFGPTFPNPPMRFHNVDGHDVDLKRLDPSLTNAIHMSGDVTVINAVLGSIDVDAGFDVDIGLDWKDNVDGTQMLHADPGTPDVHLSALAWLVSILLGFITVGVVGVIVAVVVMVVVTNIASSIGGSLVKNQVTNAVTGISALPSELIGIGTIASKFENPITIAPDGLVFGG